MANSTVQTAERSGADFAAAHRALVHDPSVQFQLLPIEPPAPPPAWLKTFAEWLGWAMRPVAQFFRWIDALLPAGIAVRVLFWGVIAIAVAAVVAIVIGRLRGGRWRLPRRRPRTGPLDDADDWRPAAAPARRWLEEAEALAAAGRYAEAAHHLLRRSVEDIATRRPLLVQPALTARELAGAEAVPPPARALFADIAALVERSLFGGRAVNAAEWHTARDAYARFTLGRSWEG